MVYASFYLFNLPFSAPSLAVSLDPISIIIRPISTIAVAIFISNVLATYCVVLVQGKPTAVMGMSWYVKIHSDAFW